MAEILRGPFNLVVPLPGESSVAKAARDARDAAQVAAASTDADVIATAADRVQTGLDRVQTGIDRTATAADRVATAGDRVQTGLDRTATGSDRTATGVDAAAAAADRVQAGLDRVQTGIDRTTTTAARAAVEAAVLGASIGSPVIPLIGTADFNAGLTFSRASTATLQQPFAAPTALTEFASGAPRWDAQFGLRLEAAATALDTNPRFEGAVAGTPGTTPTGLTIFSSGSLARQIVGIGTEGGFPFIDVQHTLTNTNNLTGMTDYGNVNGVAGLVYSGAVAVKLLAGTPPAMTVVMNDGTTNGTSSSSFTASESYQFITPPAMTAAGASPIVRTRVRNGTAGFTGVFTLRYIFFNIVQSTVRSSLILPAVGVPGSTTRARDVLSGALSGLSLASPGVTILGRGMIPFTPGSGLSATLLQLDNNSAEADAIRLGTAAGSASIIGTGLTTAGGAVNTATLGSFTPGTEFTWGLSYNRLTGGAIFNFNGGASIEIPAGAAPLQAITTHARFGGRIASGFGLNGFMRRTTGRPFIVSATDLAALVAAA